MSMRLSVLLTLLLCIALMGCPPRLDVTGTPVNDDDAADDDDASDDDDFVEDDDDTPDDPWDDDDDDPWDDDDDDDDDQTDPAECPDVGALQAIGWAEDENGTTGEVFGAVAEITLVGGVLNPCDEVVVFETNSGCLFDSWTLYAGSGQAVGMGCDDAITLWTIEPGQVLLEETAMGMMEPDFYVWEARFESTWIEVYFDVVAP
jgi:hypothetical protein